MNTNIPYFGAQPGIGANFPGTQHIIFETEFRRRLRDLSIVSKITSQSWKGRFRNSGVQIEIPCLPLVKTHKRKPGDKVVYQNLKGAKETFTINRERDVAFHVEIEDNIFAPQNLDSVINKEAQAQMTEDKDYEFFADIPFKCHAANCGNAAGVRYGSYELGTAVAPVHLFKTDAECAAATVPDGHKKCTATEFVSRLVATVKQWPGGSQGELKVIVPSTLQQLLINSELKYADQMGDQMSVLRKGVDYIGDIAGASLIGCDQLPMWDGVSTSNLPMRHLCMVVNSKAIEYVDEVVFDENLKDKDQYGNFYRTLHIYDWFARYPELFGYGIVAIGA